jgi:hypothetical protein
VTREFACAIAFSGLLVVVGAAGAARSDIEGRAGQIIFVPVPEIIGPADRAGPTLEVWSCEPGQEGWTVTGHIVPGTDDPVIAVSGGMEGQPGARVGMALAKDSAPSEFREVGDFQVLLPWATHDSVFAVQAVQPARGYGPTARCPSARTG